ncbi:hypothetical protein pEaSNUABM30_00162 [Erwinia phage pEa_SNUABM_30]|uniref:Uncharacterized protein n=1 Tax=Erwinia phage pEa_SNUABM_30 TaxID=2869553 RepID=A0AAE9BS83_9CAUD|nr:hypothetical protein MPK69_gp162 [Erwinia phage pEa_SNUABM_30]UAW53280.1 hypothetical protein pEaSNUABM30_00162 [Erwinia phage pEa_SNUABM_30]
MKERLPHTLDMDMLRSEAARLSMNVSLWNQGDEEPTSEVMILTLDYSNFVHSVSVMSNLLMVMRDKLECTNVWLVSHECLPHPEHKDHTRINVTVFPRTIKELCNAS